MGPIARDIYKFQPLVLSVKDTEMIHGTNEHVSIANIERMVRFYQRLVETAAAK
jgi:carboxypeptidase PM20D1